MPPESISDLVYIDATGYHYADYPTFLAWLEAQYQGIYGADVYIDPDSMDGQFLAVLSQAFYDTAALGSAVYNSFSPLTAQGYGLARLVKINGLEKESASYSTVGLTIVGVAGTVITNGIAADGLNQQWLLPTTVTIPGGGSVTVTATAAVIGAVFADSNTVTTIFTPTTGWQTVNNSSAAVPGNPVESDAQLRIRQSESTSIPALTVIEATRGAILNVEGVTACLVYENDTTVTDGNGIPANTVNAVVAGSYDQTAVAEVIQQYKTPGVGTWGGDPGNPDSGNVTTNLTDSQGMPVTINYTDIADVSPGAEIKVAITGTAITVGPNQYSPSYDALIKAAVAAFINAIGIGAIRTGGVINWNSIFAPSYLNGAPQGQSYIISAMTIALNGGSPGTSNLTINYNQLPVCNPSTDVTVSIS